MSYAEVIPGVFIGDITSPNLIGGLDLVINASNKIYESKVPTVHILDIEDIVPLFNIDKFATNILDKVDKACDIAEAKEPKRLLIHCAAGMNRSALVICTWLIRKGYKPADAIEKVTAANNTRGIKTLTNPLFRALIEDM